MASSTAGPLRTGSTGRGFASIDPERQGEIPGRTVRIPDEGGSPLRARPAPDWMRMPPERDGGSFFEGGSSRRNP